MVFGPMRFSFLATLKHFVFYVNLISARGFDPKQWGLPMGNRSGQGPFVS